MYWSRRRLMVFEPRSPQCKTAAEKPRQNHAGERGPGGAGGPRH
jgi:hypothetical protein